MLVGLVPNHGIAPEVRVVRDVLHFLRAINELREAPKGVHVENADLFRVARSLYFFSLVLP